MIGAVILALIRLYLRLYNHGNEHIEWSTR